MTELGDLNILYASRELLHISYWLHLTKNYLVLNQLYLTAANVQMSTGLGS